MNSERRDVKSRNNNIFHKLSRSLIKVGLMPNHISIASTLFALLGTYGFYLASHTHFTLGLILAFSGIQLRLICNLIDGLMAVEGGLSSPQGELYNDIPDRFSDWFLIYGAGYFITSMPYGTELTWAAIVLAILTAYVRVLGASLEMGHDFGGPMAKQHRMAILNFAIIGTVIEKLFFSGTSYSMYTAIVIIALGSLTTIIRRVGRTSKKLDQAI